MNAILRQEPRWDRLAEALLGAEIAVMSAAVVVEASIVIEAASGEAGVKEVHALLDAAASRSCRFSSSR